MSLFKHGSVDWTYVLALLPETNRALRVVSSDQAKGTHHAHDSPTASFSGRLSVVDTAPDAKHRNVRVTFTLPAYDDSGHITFFTVLGDLAPDAFIKNAAGANAKAIADEFPVYVFPTLTGDPLSVGNNRQADLIDLRHGHFSHDPLGLWVHVFVTWTPRALNTAIAPDAFLATVRHPDGTPLPAEQSFVTTFNALQTTGDFPK